MLQPLLLHRVPLPAAEGQLAQERLASIVGGTCCHTLWRQEAKATTLFPLSLISLLRLRAEGYEARSHRDVHEKSVILRSQKPGTHAKPIQ